MTEPQKKPGPKPSILGPKAVRFEVAQRKLNRAKARREKYQVDVEALDRAVAEAQAEFDDAKREFAAELDNFG